MWQKRFEHENQPRFKPGQLVVYNPDSDWGNGKDRHFQVESHSYGNGWRYSGMLIGELVNRETKGLAVILTDEIPKYDVPEIQLLDRSKYHELSKSFPKKED